VVKIKHWQYARKARQARKARKDIRPPDNFAFLAFPAFPAFLAPKILRIKNEGGNNEDSPSTPANFDHNLSDVFHGDVRFSR
jgi:hypothetical protein